MEQPNSTTNLVREQIVKHVEQLVIVGGFSEEELCFEALKLAEKYYADSSQLRFVHWRTFHNIRDDLFKLQGESDAK